MARKIEIQINVTRTGAGAKQATDELEKLDKAATKSQKGLDLQSKAMGALKNAIAGVSFAAITAQIIKFGSESVKAFSQFDKGIREVFTLLPGITATARQDVENQVLQMSATLGRSTEEITKALYESLSANVPPDNVFQFLEISAQAAKGGVTDLAVVVDGLTSVINAYGLQVSDATKVSDILFQTVKFGKVRFEELTTDLSTVVPVAASLGVPLEEIGALLATITAQGTQTSVAATQIRSALLDLSKEGGKASDAFKELTGVSFQQFLASGGTVQEAFVILANEAERTGVNLTDFFGRIEGGQAALQATGQGVILYNDIIKEVENSAGSTKQAVDEFSGSLDESNNRTQAAIEQLKILVGEVLTPTKMAWNELVIAVTDGAGAIISASNNINQEFAMMAEATKDPVQEALKLAAASNELQDQVFTLSGAALSLTSVYKDTEEALFNTVASTIQVEEGFTGLADRSAAVESALKKVYGSAVTVTDGEIRLNGALVGSAYAMYDQAAAAQEAARRFDGTATATTRMTKVVSLSSYAYDELQDKQMQIAITSGELTDATEDLTDATEDQVSAWDEAIGAAALVQAALNKLSGAMENEAVSATARAERTREQIELDKKAADALEQHNRKMAGYYQAALDAETGAGLYNTAISQIGTSSAFVSNLTGEQAARLQALQAEYNNVTTQLEAYRIGTEGIFLTDEERTEQMQELGEKAAFLAEQMAPLNEVGGEYAETTTRATFNTQAVGNALYDAAAAAGASDESMALLGLSLGIVSEEAAEAALKSAILQAGIDNIAASFANGKIGADEAKTAMQELIAEVEALDLALDPASGSVVHLAEDQIALAAAIGEPINKIDTLIEKMGLIPEEVNSVVNVDTTEAENRISSLEARLLQLGSGGQPGQASGGYQPAPRAAGGPVSGGVTYNTGEHGTEMYRSPNYQALVSGLFTPPESGQIIPAGTTKSYMDRSTRNVTIYGNADLTILQKAFTDEQRRRSRF